MKHVGFSGDAPGEVFLSEQTFVREVDRYEKLNIRAYYLTFWCLWIVLDLIAGGILLYRQMDVIPTSQRSWQVWDIFFLAFAIAGTVILFTQGHIVKLILISKIGLRPGKLFEPDWKCIFVHIEDSETFDKMKLTSNDFGLLRVGDGLLELEMAEHRCRFSAQDVVTSPCGVKGKKGNTAVMLTCDFGQWLWSVALLAPLQNWNILLGANQQSAARWLHRKIETGLAE